MTKTLLTKIIIKSTLMMQTLLSQSSIKKLFTICCLIYSIASGGMFGAENPTIPITQELLTEKIQNTIDRRAQMFFRASRDALQDNDPSYQSFFRAAECALKIYMLTDPYTKPVLEQAITHYLSNHDHAGDAIYNVYFDVYYT